MIKTYLFENYVLDVRRKKTASELTLEARRAIDELEPRRRPRDARLGRPNI